MTGFLWQPWTWFAGAFALTFALIQLAARYLANRPLTDTDQYCAEADEFLTRRAACQRPTLVAARLEAVQDATGFGVFYDPQNPFDSGHVTNEDMEWLAEQNGGDPR